MKMSVEVMALNSLFGRPGRSHFALLLFVCVFIVLMADEVTANVVVIGKNASLSFSDIEASFALSIKESGICGVLHLAEPLDACSPLTNKVVADGGSNSSFVLIIRGACTFEDKVRRAQSAGFKAAILYDNEDDGSLVAMAGNGRGIKIHAVFVSKSSGETLKKIVGLPGVEFWIIPTFENSAWSIMATSFISFLAMFALLATCFFVRRQRIRSERPRAPHGQEFHGMSRRLVKAMPSVIFTSPAEDYCTSTTCAICLEDYSVGEKLRVLPCHHKFHAACVDSWLMSWRTFCPVCKRDARTSSGDPPASECTPLLSSGSSSLSSSVASSLYSLLPASSAIQIGSASYRSPTNSRLHSLSSTPFLQQSIRSYTNSPALSARSSVDLRNMSSQRSHASHLVSPHSLGFPSFLSPLNSRYQLPLYIPSSSHGSPSVVGSSSRQTFLRHCNESAGSMSPFASAQSLPGC
ncbi:receptor homology region, transmembrane domain- and RING domain-containing protein 2-like [Aristolochia californica]|uniref:receptor homology region, transmembrane domain- and RING domain-containing protein 2-like n=1 Tax=Aristolochia californica TaxID=171875 RepID=UPI0035E117DE